jgi:hypothetical protein
MHVLVLAGAGAVLALVLIGAAVALLLTGKRDDRPRDE